MTKRKTPVSSFGPELLAALKEGSERETKLQFPSRAIATRFMQRINQLRVAMREENHLLAEVVMRAGVRRDPDNICGVVIAPRDSEFAQSLRSVGFAEPSLPEPPPPGILDAEVIPGSVDDFLGGLGGSSKKDVDPGGKTGHD